MSMGLLRECCGMSPYSTGHYQSPESAVKPYGNTFGPPGHSSVKITLLAQTIPQIHTTPTIVTGNSLRRDQGLSRNTRTRISLSSNPTS